MDNDLQARAHILAQHYLHVAEKTEEFSAQALAADRRMRALKGAGQIEEAERYGAAELARLHLAFVQLGAEFEGHARELLGMARHKTESLHEFWARVNDRLQDTARQLGALAERLEDKR